MHLKYTVKQLANLEVYAGGNYTVAGRNMGQATAFNAGLFYAFYLSKKTKS
jgi:hypothetical protein